MSNFQKLNTEILTIKFKVIKICKLIKYKFSELCLVCSYVELNNFYQNFKLIGERLTQHMMVILCFGLGFTQICNFIIQPFHSCQNIFDSLASFSKSEHDGPF